MKQKTQDKYSKQEKAEALIPIDAILVARTGVVDRFLVGRHGLDRNPVE